MLYPFHVKEVKGSSISAIAPISLHNLVHLDDGCGTRHQYAGLRQKEPSRKPQLEDRGKLNELDLGVNFIPSSQKRF